MNRKIQTILIKQDSREAELAEIQLATARDMPLGKNGWNFNWRNLYKVEGGKVYKIYLIDSPKEVQGLVMLSLMNGEMLYMNNIEVAPHNLGKNGEYDRVAASLIAFPCRMSLEKGKGAYKGYLSFESKTELIPLYKEKYGAILAIGQRMYIDPKTGISLIEKYLK